MLAILIFFCNFALAFFAGSIWTSCASIINKVSRYAFSSIYLWKKLSQ